ncbi:MAG: hypothetical protein ABIO60_11135 [Aquaticitalea sp.]
METQIPEDFKNMFNAQLEGQVFVVQHIYTTKSLDANNANFMAITASKTDYQSIIIYLPFDIVIGTYLYCSSSVLTIPNLNITYSNLEDVLESGIGNGEITITERNIFTHHIKGTFQCVVNSQNGSIHLISYGSFDVVYP